MLCKLEKVHYVVIESYKVYEVEHYYQAALGFALVKNVMAAHSCCSHQQRQWQALAGKGCSADRSRCALGRDLASECQSQWMGLFQV